MKYGRGGKWILSYGKQHPSQPLIYWTSWGISTEDLGWVDTRMAAAGLAIRINVIKIEQIHVGPGTDIRPDVSVGILPRRAAKMPKKKCRSGGRGSAMTAVGRTTNSLNLHSNRGTGTYGKLVLDFRLSTGPWPGLVESRGSVPCCLAHGKSLPDEYAAQGAADPSPPHLRCQKKK